MLQQRGVFSQTKVNLWQDEVKFLEQCYGCGTGIANKFFLCDRKGEIPRQNLLRRVSAPTRF